ncbi:MAG: SPOR domain-containing protein [Parvibaculum sp.]|nr:SPOR domain-containing protein [Parvibaculum sp.]
MTRKPASLTSDLLARKGEAGPSTVDPISRVTLAGGRQPSLNGIGAGEGPSRGLYTGSATEMHAMDEEERPSPPEPEIIYTPEDEDSGGRTRLIAGAFVGLALLGGVLIALSLNDTGPNVAPVTPDIASAPPAAETSAGKQAAVADEDASRASANLRTEPLSDAVVPAADEPAGPAAKTQEPKAEEAKAEEPAGAPEKLAAADAPPESAAPKSLAPEAASKAVEPAAAPKPTTAKPVAAAAAPASAGAWVVQIMALREEAAAKSAWANMQKTHSSILGGHALDIEKADLGDKGTFYRVRAAGFDTKSAAQSACSQLKAAGQDCLVKSR